MKCWLVNRDPYNGLSGQITIIPKPELRRFWWYSLTKPVFGVTSADVVIICPGLLQSLYNWVV